ncbi:3-dehydroquinate dehydratase [Rhodobacteraceae bacterium WD3A24]|nr:3-dehydroquinate dehydratase [Rhodobacteraceae bacterium WD3A24]
MTLGYIVTTGRGASDRLLARAAAALEAEGLRLAGAVQDNIALAPDRACRMELRLLGGGGRVCISHDRGAGARGCRLDSDGLERAVMVAAAGLDAGADLLIVNKIGKQELAGHGFAPLLVTALERGTAVLTSVNTAALDAFHAYAGDFAEPVAPELPAILAWARTQAATGETGMAMRR